MPTYHDESAYSKRFVPSVEHERREQIIVSAQPLTFRPIALTRGRHCDQFVRSLFGSVSEELSRAEVRSAMNRLAGPLDAQPPGLHACASHS